LSDLIALMFYYVLFLIICRLLDGHAKAESLVRMGWRQPAMIAAYNAAILAAGTVGFRAGLCADAHTSTKQAYRIPPIPLGQFYGMIKNAPKVLCLNVLSLCFRVRWVLYVLCLHGCKITANS